MTYSNYRVWVLDDGNRDWLRDFAHSVGAHYLARTDHSHAKAGNINHGLRHVASLEQSPEFISILDADFVPAPNFLSRALTLFRKGDVGMFRRHSILSIRIRSRTTLPSTTSCLTSSAISSMS